MPGAVADPGFPRGGNNGGSRFSQTGVGVALTSGSGAKPNIWQDFYRKLHENERNWKGGGYVPNYPLDPPMGTATIEEVLQPIITACQQRSFGR